MCILNLRRGDESHAGRQKQLRHGNRPTSQAAAASLKVKHVHSTPPRRHSAKGFNAKFQTRFLSFLAASSVWPSVYLSGSALGVAPRYTPSPPPTPPHPSFALPRLDRRRHRFKAEPTTEGKRESERTKPQTRGRVCSSNPLNFVTNSAQLFSAKLPFALKEHNSIALLPLSSPLL